MASLQAVSAQPQPPPTLQDLFLILPASNRDVIWAEVFYGYTAPDRLYTLVEYVSETNFFYFGCTTCGKPHDPPSFTRTPFLFLNKAIHADMQRLVLAKVEKVTFCHYSCAFHFLSTATRWGVLGWTKSFDVEDETSYGIDGVHRGTTLLLAAESFSKRMMTLNPEDGTTAKWEAGVESEVDQSDWRLVIKK